MITCVVKKSGRRLQNALSCLNIHSLKEEKHVQIHLIQKYLEITSRGPLGIMYP